MKEFFTRHVLRFNLFSIRLHYSKIRQCWLLDLSILTFGLPTKGQPIRGLLGISLSRSYTYVMAFGINFIARWNEDHS